MPNVLKPSQYKQQRNNISADISVIEQTNMLTMAEQMGKELINSAEKKAALIISAAQRQAEEINQKANIEFENAYANGVEAAKKDGFKQGYDEGFNEGAKAAEEKSDRLTNDLLKVIDKLRAAKEAVMEQQKAELPDIVIEIANTVISQVVNQHKELMCEIICNSLKDTYEERHLNIYVSKDIYDLMNGSNQKFINQLKSTCGDVRLMQNSEIEDTDCIVEASDYILDISIKSQLEKIKAVLRN